MKPPFICLQFVHVSLPIWEDPLSWFTLVFGLITVNPGFFICYDVKYWFLLVSVFSIFCLHQSTRTFKFQIMKHTFFWQHKVVGQNSSIMLRTAVMFFGVTAVAGCRSPVLRCSSMRAKHIKRLFRRGSFSKFRSLPVFSGCQCSRIEKLFQALDVP